MKCQSRPDAFLLPALAMGLIYCSISFGIIVLNLRDGGKAGNGLEGLAHFILALAAGLALHRAEKARRPFAHFRLFAVLTALIGLFSAVVPILPGEWSSLVLDGKLPVISTSAGLFMALGLALFFRTAPAGREGLFYGLLMAFGELLWVVLFPFLSGVADANPASGGEVFSHLSAFCCLAMGSAGMCLYATFSARGLRNATPGVSSAGNTALSRETRSALLWIFGAGIGLFTLVGLEMGMRLPKTGLAPGFVSLPHFIPLLFLPLAGKMLDGKNPGRFMALLIPACLLAPFLDLAQAKGLLEPLSLFCLLAVVRQALLLAVFTVCARLVKTHALLPLLLSLAYCLHLMQFVGALLWNFFVPFPSGVFITALILTAGTGVCLWRFRRLLEETPKLWKLPEKDAPEPEPEPDMEKFRVFADVHDLTGREQEILFGLIRGASLEDLSREFGVALSTVRYHQTGILKKTGMTSRSNLLRHFIFWHPGQA